MSILHVAAIDPGLFTGLLIASAALGGVAVQLYRARSGKESEQASAIEALSQAAAVLVTPLTTRLQALEAGLKASEGRETKCLAELAEIKSRMSRIEAAADTAATSAAIAVDAAATRAAALVQAAATDAEAAVRTAAEVTAAAKEAP